ncbi:hypothetical protein Bbelb_325560 [Branchiostoma belcheri]|nr:hypothetical protein Bbelb_325560 [Branchiostoma belcheri]
MKKPLESRDQKAVVTRIYAIPEACYGGGDGNWVPPPPYLMFIAHATCHCDGIRTRQPARVTCRVNALNNKVNALNNRVNALNNRVNALNNNMNALNNRVNALNNNVNAFNNKVNALNSRVNAFNNKANALNNKVNALNNRVNALKNKRKCLRVTGTFGAFSWQQHPRIQEELQQNVNTAEETQVTQPTMKQHRREEKRSTSRYEAVPRVYVTYARKGGDSISRDTRYIRRTCEK